MRSNAAEQLGVTIRALGGGMSREQSLERPLLRKKRTPAEALVVARPGPVRREARSRRPTKRHLAAPVLQEEEEAMKQFVHVEPGLDLTQLQELLAIPMELSKKIGKWDAECVREVVQQVRAEFGDQRREQRKTLQQPITGVKELMGKIAHRTASEGSAAKRARTDSVKLSPDGEGGSEECSTAVFVTNATGALGILVDVPLAELAEARSTPRAADPWKRLQKLDRWSLRPSSTLRPARHPRLSSPWPRRRLLVSLLHRQLRACGQVTRRSSRRPQPTAPCSTPWRSSRQLVFYAPTSAEKTSATWKMPDLSHPSRRERKSSAGREVPILTKGAGRRVGAAQVPARTHRAWRPQLALQALTP